MEPYLKILILEDDESDADLINRVLKKADISFDSKVVDSKQDFITSLEEFVPDAIFSDHSLPQFNSLEAFDIFKRRNLNIPFILVTGTVSEEFAVKCLKEGIDDYILKDNLIRLPSSLRSALKKRKLETDQAGYIEKIKVQNENLIKINAELDRFVYSLSHELKAPLVNTIGLIYFVKQAIAENIYDHIEEYVDLIERSIDKLLHTIEEIIYYSINNKTEYKKELIDIQNLIDTAWKKMEYLDNFTRIVNRVNINQDWPWYSDKNRTSIILENLISNAIKFQDINKKNSAIIIDVHVLIDKVLINIIDNGIGISDNHINKIFNMFYRATPISEGPGLGLYLVKETVQKLNGKIEVHSQPGIGTTFNIELPNNGPS